MELWCSSAAAAKAALGSLSKMLKRANRLKRQEDFNLVRAEGRRIKQGHCLLSWRPNQLNLNRAGVVIGKKATPSAVRRNSIRRLLNDTFRDFFANRDNSPYIDAVVVVIFAPENLAELKEELNQCLRAL